MILDGGQPETAPSIRRRHPAEPPTEERLVKAGNLRPGLRQASNNAVDTIHARDFTFLGVLGADQLVGAARVVVLWLIGSPEPEC